MHAPEVYDYAIVRVVPRVEREEFINAGAIVSCQRTGFLRAAMALDEADAFPEAAVSYLHNLGLHRSYVPEQLGGRFGSGETFVALGRVLARRTHLRYQRPAKRGGRGPGPSDN